MGTAIIKTREELVSIREVARKEGKKVGFTSGSFDLIHAGHLDYLEKAKAMCDILIVAVNSDSSIKQYKSPDRPIIPEKWRAKLMAGLKPVDYVFIFNETNNKVNIQTLKPDFYIKAGDWQKSKLTSAPIVESYGGKVINIPVTEEIKTTDIINKIKMLEGKVSDGELLGVLKQIHGTIELPKPTEKQKAVFLDRDGTINEDFGYVSDPKKFKLLPRAVEGIKMMQNDGYKIVIVTNQTGIGMGYYTREDFYAVSLEMFKQVSPEGIRFDKIYFCPHSLSEGCECRKPSPGLLKRAEEELYLDLSKCYMIGDKAADIRAGKAAGTKKTILVATGHGMKERGKAEEDYFVQDLVEAAEIIRST